MAAVAALAAVVVVTALGLAIRAPLAGVPENTMKLIVGIMLTSFGIFWGSEGYGASWPGQDVSLLMIVPAVALCGGRLVVEPSGTAGSCPAESPPEAHRAHSSPNSRILR